MKKFTLYTLMLVAFLAGSCKKLIEIPANPPSQIQQDAIFADSASVMGAVAGVYSYYYNEFGFSDGNLSKCTGLSSDELVPSTVYDQAIPQFYANQLLADNNYVGNLWTGIYNALYKVNVDIDGIQRSTGLSASLKQQLTGEMKTLRALYYFHLLNLFGGVPLVTSVDYATTAKLPRATPDQVYAQILADLADARGMLNPQYPSEGHARVNLYVAEALSAKVYLYQGKWQDAFQMADDVIKAGGYQLEPDLNNVFLEGSVEAIWQIPAQGQYNQTAEAQNFATPLNSMVPNYTIADNLKNAFETGDPRWTTWVGHNVVDVNGTPGDFYYPYKYRNLTPPYATTEDFMVFRLAELYLIRAEANAQLGNLAAAVEDLFQVRQRVGLSKPVAGSQDQVLNAVAHERQVELFTEWGNRWFDLKRTNTINAVLGAAKPNWKADAALYPIPYQEIRKNPALTQNHGYN